MTEIIHGHKTFSSNDESIVPSSFSVKDKKQLIDDITNLKKIEHIEIFKIFKNNHIHYTENKNGIFINLSNISDTILLEVQTCLKFYKKNNQLLDEYTMEKKKIEKHLFQEKHKIEDI